MLASTQADHFTRYHSAMLTTASSAESTLPQWLGQRTRQHGHRIAVTFVGDDGSEHSWTYEQLWARACVLARRLPAVDQRSPRALLLFPPGIEFLAGFLGCQIAGWIPVPTCYPKPGREMPRLDSAARDCAPSAIIGDQATIDGIDTDKLCDAARRLPLIATDVESIRPDEVIDPQQLSIDPDSLALLQYTSGSTSEPKGVMVGHRNLMANLESIRRGFGIEFADDRSDPECGVFWLPFFHDMGLVGGILEPLYLGGRTILMSPRSFLQRPIRWLKYISDYQAVISGAPNFAYQLCVDRITPSQTDDIDLHRWRVAFSGAEPVLPRTLRDFANRFAPCGFSSSAFYPCYGLAESTLLAAGGSGPAEPEVLTVDRDSLSAGKPTVTQPGRRGRDGQELVSCGQPSHGTQLVLVDPESCCPVGDRVVGEIWLRGASVAQGYWNREEENQTRFNAEIAGGQKGYFRSGDLAFLHEGKLFVTGRIKDVIILRGRNLFPQDIETTVRETVGSEGGQCAAFAVDGVRGEALALVAEVPRRADESSLPDLVRSIRRAVIDLHEVDPRHVLLVRQATVPLTSSGKVQRSRCRELFHQGQIKTKYRYDRASGSEQTPIAIPVLPPVPTAADRQPMTETIEQWMAEWLVVRAGVAPSDVDLEKPFADYGLDSLTAVEMSGEIEDWSGVELTPVVAWNYPTVSRLSKFITDQLCEKAGSEPEQTEVPDAELEDLLSEIEQLSDDEIEHALADKRRP